MTNNLLENTRHQISSIIIDRNRPLIISDADEVLVVFMARFELFLNEQNYFFDWSSFRLTGNIRRKSDNYTFSQNEVLSLLDTFFAKETQSLDAVPGAIEALNLLSLRAQIVILSNVPFTYHAERERCLVEHGMNYPLIINNGLKGPAVRALAGPARAPVFFIDDSPSHIESVATQADHVRRIHFVHDTRLAELVGPAPESHHRIDSWPEARTTIEKELSAAGF
jgi:hypothetical protein